MSQMDVQYLSGSLQGYDGEQTSLLTLRHGKVQRRYTAYETVHLGNGISVLHTNIGFAVSLLVK